MIEICSDRIDWAATGEMLAGWGAIASAGAVIWAGNKAAQTVASWKRQRIAERKFEQAERILTATWESRDAMDYIRAPAIWPHENHIAEEKLKQEPGWTGLALGAKQKLITTQAILNRVAKTAEKREALVSCMPMGRALFSEELEKAIDRFVRQFGVVALNADAYGQDNGQDIDFSKNIRETIWPVGHPPQDEVSVAVRESIATIEANCLPILRV
jgi:hypothetical protein